MGSMCNNATTRLIKMHPHYIYIFFPYFPNFPTDKFQFLFEFLSMYEYVCMHVHSHAFI